MRDDPTAPRKSAVELLPSGQIHVSGRDPVTITAECLTIGRSEAADVQLDDPEVSGLHCELSATPAGVMLRDLSSTNGTHVGAARIDSCVLTASCSITVGGQQLRFEPSSHRIPDLTPKAERFGALVGRSTAMRRVYQALASVAPTELSVLVTGETGTGKELVARGLHDESHRKAGPFVVVDCAALPSSLAESHLFGHEKGSFTGATARVDGAFQRADGGTIFLDELGELPIDMQPKLLRAIAERAVQRVGGRGYETVDVRVVAATRRDLRVEMNAERFREDLFYRIAQVRVELPPLRARTGDLPALVSEACKRVGRPDHSGRVTVFLADRFATYDWPGNVRELVNVASVLASLGADAPEQLLLVEGEHTASSPSHGAPSQGVHAGAVDASQSFADAKRVFEHAYFEQLLEASEHNLSEVSRRCGLARHNVRAHLRKLGLWR